MHKDAVIEFFNGIPNTASVLGVTKHAIYQWKEIIPEKRALKIERITNGKLKYNSALYDKNTLNPV